MIRQMMKKTLLFLCVVPQVQNYRALRAKR